MNKKLTALIILDGYGISDTKEGNAVYAAQKPNLDTLMSTCPNSIIRTSGMDVGLPAGQMGNSEVGHTNIGAGRVVYQELTRISKAIEDGDFFHIQELSDAMKNCGEKGTQLHLMGLLSDGGVHSHNTHLYALLDLAKMHGLKHVYVHCFLDGRDVPPDSAKGFVEELAEKMCASGVGKIASVMGRYYAMDRDNRWDRVKLAYDAMTIGAGVAAASATDAVACAYARDEFDEFVKPIIIYEDEHPITTIKQDDTVIFFNFRPDRAREITRAFTEPDFKGFERQNGWCPLKFVCFTQYDISLTNVEVAFKPAGLENTLGEYISRLGLKQLRIAETEKYAHVTFFFNGGRELPYAGEDRVLVPSPKVATYDQKPEMSAYEVTDEVVKRIRSGIYDLIVLNFANCDMVGHTGIFDAARAAVEAVDICLGKIVPEITDCGGTVLITADHGNAEQMKDFENGGAFTAHTTNPVPLIVKGPRKFGLEKGRLADIAPTILDIMGLEKPTEMTGHSLLIK